MQGTENINLIREGIVSMGEGCSRAQRKGVWQDVLLWPADIDREHTYCAGRQKNMYIPQLWSDIQVYKGLFKQGYD